MAGPDVLLWNDAVVSIKASQPQNDEVRPLFCQGKNVCAAEGAEAAFLSRSRFVFDQGIPPEMTRNPPHRAIALDPNAVPLTLRQE